MKEELRQLGLTKGETNVYLALLKLSSSTVGAIVKESGVSYSKIYEVLGRLMEKGLASFTLKEKTKYFQGVKPNRLLEFIKQKEEEIKKNKEAIENILPDLEAMSDKKGNQSAEIFIGLKGLKTAYEILLKGYSKNIPLCYFYVHDEKYAEIANDFYEKEFSYFKELKIKLQGVSSRDLKQSKSFKKPPKFADLRFVDSPLPSTIDIYQDKILITTWRDKPFAYLITSKEISENFMNYFNQLWKIARH
jgi:HTH-type transcriptional regulator, sugar sensing transcriptional regulator